MTMVNGVNQKDMKSTIRIPTVQFGFMEVEWEANSYDEVVKTHNEMVEKYKASVPQLNNNDF